ncbi:uncharacterized protein MYCFIDRAFT_46360 [Pseudocercospora fijiensis CIRAD86]|uniref:HAD-like protein n=1 Tax=Pseudocercospora fijiensis (strain CIRAD86) TaxID=383855 RepID=M2ZZ72_PSEFD|nr:uncharacterized protein MYCFIDRAFT_46360 [Pseudocercospora fijiensis CIRAD86]EME77456.1 hypothetical protein MYCFIDRAFT_46360 [Pseudocercospora fijiensis CIRAD86]
MPKSISFDILGTCFAFESAIQAIHTRLGPKLAQVNASPKSVFFGWFFAAQRDFTYTSMSGSYTPIAQILKSTFRRACAVNDLPLSEIGEGDVEAVMAEMKTLKPRAGLKECFDGLRGAGWDVFGVTNGGKEISLGYFEGAGIFLDGGHLVSCDEVGVAKPDGRVYEFAKRVLRSAGHDEEEEEEERWFVAAHAWDLMGARKAGFRTAFLRFEEHDPCTDVFGEFDLYVQDMGELLEKMKELP